MTQPLTLLSEEEAAFRDLVADFAAREIEPLRAAMDEAQEMRPELVRQLFALDLMGIEVPEQYGGAGSTFFNAILVIEELAKVDPSVSVLVDVQNTLVANCLLNWSSEAQKQRYLPRLCRDQVGAYALSEPGSGSDAFALATRATARAGGTPAGSKLWSLGGPETYTTVPSRRLTRMKRSLSSGA